MNLKEVYTRVVETTGLNVLTPESLSVAVRNCLADLTSRGYREFKEKIIRPEEFAYYQNNLIQTYVPKDLRRMLYCRLHTESGIYNATRLALTNPGLLSLYNRNTKEIRSDFSVLPPVIYYIKNDRLNLEWKESGGQPISVMLGYYAKLPTVEIATEQNQLESIEIDIREEFKDAIVLYCCYFYYARSMKDPEYIQFYLSQYKYYVEDILHELASEDLYQEEDSVITVEGDY